MGLVKEFKEFAIRGNVIDMAVGLVIGAAFGKIVSSIVADIIMPFISLLTGGVHFTEWKTVLRQAVMDGEDIVFPEIAVNYGMFIQVVIDFIFIAIAVFFVVKGINKLKKKEEKKPAAPTADITLLTEIRDLLKK